MQESVKLQFDHETLLTTSTGFRFIFYNKEDERLLRQYSLFTGDLGLLSPTVIISYTHENTELPSGHFIVVLTRK